MPKPPTRTAPDAIASDGPLAPLEDSHIWPGNEVTVRGVRLHVRTTPGDGTEPALLVHGLGGSAHNWTDLAALLRNRLAIEAIDLPGHGRSGQGRSYRPSANADLLIAYLEQSDRGPVHLMGNSMGGAICILVAARRPDLVRSLTLISPAVPDNRARVYPLRNDPRMAFLVLPVLGERLAKRFSRKFAPEARVKGTIALCFADRSRYPEERFAEAVDELRARLDLPWADGAVIRSMRGLATDQILRGRSGWATMRRITSPTLVIWGDQDKLVAPDLAPYVAAAIPDAQLVVLEDIGHTAMMEDPRTTASLVLGLLDRADPAPNEATGPASETAQHDA